MEKLDLNLPVLNEIGEPVMAPKNVAGKPVMDQLSLATSLGGSLLESGDTSEVGILRLYTWALELGKTGIIELNQADAEELKQFVINNEALFVIIKAPILKELEKLKFK